MNSDFYIPQARHLQNVVRYIWQVNDWTPYQKETILPKGVVEIIFDLGENVPVQSAIDQRPYQLAKCFINGFNTRPIQLQLPERQFFFGVQFHPVAIKHIFGIPACEFTNLLVDLTLLHPSFHSLWQQLAEADTFQARVTIISAWIENKVIQTHPQELLLNSLLEDTNSPNISVKELARTVCYSPRHLSRKIYELSGMNTEQFLLYKKYLHAVHLMHHTQLALTEIAYHSHFADQSHFIKSFKAFALITPNMYRQNKGRVLGHLFEEAR